MRDEDLAARSAIRRQWWALGAFAITLAILYGIGLILAAFVLAMFYGWMSKSQEEPRKEDLP